MTAAATAIARGRDEAAKQIATLFGVGLLPGAPGTWAALVGAAIGFAMRAWPLADYALACVVLCIVSTWAAHEAERVLGTQDDSRIVIDELVGTLCALALLDRGNVALLGVGVALFRVLDIMKPWPISWLDRNVHGGLGVMLDDVVAGVIATLAIAAGLGLLAK